MGKFRLFVDGNFIAEDQAVDLVAGSSVTLTPTDTEGDHTQPVVTIDGPSADVLLGPVTFSQTGTIATTTGKTRWYNDSGAARTLTSARGSVDTAPVGDDILVDINIDGTSVWASTQANRITIADGTNTDEGGAFDTSSIPDGSYVTVDIDQVGSGTAGADLTVTLWMS